MDIDATATADPLAGVVVGVVVPESARVFRSGVFASIKAALGIDEAIAFTVLGRAWSTVAGVLTLFAISHFLTPAEQGYYYTFSSLVTLQVIFELGFSFVILQLASHEAAHLTISSRGITGDATAHSRLASILRKTVGYYLFAAIAMALALIPTGIIFFSRNAHPGSPTGWIVPWCTVALFASFNLLLNAVCSFLEGCGFVPETAKMRLGQAVLGSLFAWSGMAMHLSLFTPALMICGQLVWSVRWLNSQRVLLRGLLHHKPREHTTVVWKTEIWPFQWRLAVSCLSGMFIFQLFSPVMFALEGPIAAGQMGMSMSVATAISGIALAWVNTKAAPFGMLIARADYPALDRMFFVTFKQSSILLVLACSAAWAGAQSWHRLWPGSADRFLAPEALALLLATTVLNHVVFSQAVYLRAHKREPLLSLSVLSALMVAGSTLTVGKTFGAAGIMWGYFLGHGVFCALAGTWIFQRCRHAWHGNVQGEEPPIIAHKGLTDEYIYTSE